MKKRDERKRRLQAYSCLFCVGNSGILKKISFYILKVLIYNKEGEYVLQVLCFSCIIRTKEKGAERTV